MVYTKNSKKALKKMKNGIFKIVFFSYGIIYMSITL